MIGQDSFWGFDLLTDISPYKLQKGALLRRLYSTFAGGWPGVGLLLMRSVVGCALVMQAHSSLRTDPTTNVVITSSFLAIAGICLISGLWTPIVGTLVAFFEGWQVLMLTGDLSVPFLLAAIAAALAMLGPGLWSVDAHLFGWKRVEAPTRKNSSTL